MAQKCRFPQDDQKIAAVSLVGSLDERKEALLQFRGGGGGMEKSSADVASPVAAALADPVDGVASAAAAAAAAAAAGAASVDPGGVGAAVLLVPLFGGSSGAGGGGAAGEETKRTFLSSYFWSKPIIVKTGSGQPEGKIELMKHVSALRADVDGGQRCHSTRACAPTRD